VSKQYAQRQVMVRDNGVPQVNAQGDYDNEDFCSKLFLEDLLPIMESHMEGLRRTKVLVAQQYSFINKIKCIEKVYQYVSVKNPAVSVTIKTYRCAKTDKEKRLCNVIVRNQFNPVSLVNPPTNIPGTVPTRAQNLYVRELSVISQCLSGIASRELRPEFDERGLIKTQSYCCSNTYKEVMNEWWERFLSRVPGINDKANDKMHDGFFANSEIGTFSQKISMNGTMALPRKKEFARVFTPEFALYVNFTFFETDTSSLSLTLIRVQWLRNAEPVDSSAVDLPCMNYVDTLIDYVRMSTNKKGYKSCYKSTEISFLDKTRVLVNEKCIPRNQAIFVNEIKSKVVADLRTLLGPLKRYCWKPIELYIGSCLYVGSATVSRRKFTDLPYDIIVMVASFSFAKDFNDSDKRSPFPEKFTQAEISWVDNDGKSGSQTMVEDNLIPEFNRPKKITRKFCCRMDAELCAIIEKVGARCASLRWKILHKYALSSERPEARMLQGGIARKGYGNTKLSEKSRAKIAAKAGIEAAQKLTQDLMKQRKVEDEVATALASLEDLADPDYQPETVDATPTAMGKKSKGGDEDSDDEEDNDEDASLMANYVAKLKDELVYFESYWKATHPITYNKRDQKGILMVQSNKSLLHALVGSSTPVNAGWIPSSIEVELYEPKLTNAYMTFTVFTVPNIVNRRTGRPKLVVGPAALSTSNTGDDAALLGEHLKYNNDNVTRVQSIAACNDEIFHSLRNGLKAMNCLYIYDENSVLNSATNKAKSTKNWIKESEIALSSEIGALRVSWEVFMNRIICMRQDADLADIFLALDDTEEYVLTDPEGKRLFCLDPLEKSQLDDDEMRCYEMEFFEWMGVGSYPNIPWKDYVMEKCASMTSGDSGFSRKSMSEDDFAKWNQDLSFDNQFFGNVILEQGTLAKTLKSTKTSKKKRSLKVKNEPSMSGSPAKYSGSPAKYSRGAAATVQYEEFDHVPEFIPDYNRVVVDGTFENVVFSNAQTANLFGPQYNIQYT